MRCGLNLNYFYMKKILFMALLAFSLASCDSGCGSSYTPSSTYSPPTTRTVDCPYCNGGIVLNPYDGNCYYCQNCGGQGTVTVSTGSTGGSNPSFGSSNKVAVEVTGVSCRGFAGSICSCTTYKGYKNAGTDTYVGNCTNYSAGHQCGHSPKAHGL